MFLFIIIFGLSLESAQSQTRAVLRKKFQSQDFVFDVRNKPKDSTGEGGEIRMVTALQMPSLAGEGVSLVNIILGPCSINQPHMHPRLIR